VVEFPRFRGHLSAEPVGALREDGVHACPVSDRVRREAVALLRSSGKTVPRLASELGVSPQSLRNWSHQIDVDEGKAAGLSSDEREELRRLRRELRTVTEEREILKKAAAFFAKESGTR